MLVLAINYNLIKPYFAEKSTPTTKGAHDSSDEFHIESPLFHTESEGVNASMLGSFGAVIGFNICGLPCGAIGAAIGLVIGGWFDDKGIKPTFHGGSGGGSGSGGGWSPQP